MNLLIMNFATLAEHPAKTFIIYHYFLDCPTYAALRHTLQMQMEDHMTNAILKLTPTPDLHEDSLRTLFITLMLFGHKQLSLDENRQFFRLAQDYITNTKRFERQPPN